MPNRILKESICSSENINLISDKAVAFFYRLIVNSDDYGRFDGRPSIIISRCYPLRIKIIDELEVVDLLAELSKSKLITVYKKDEKYLIQISTWEKHQQIRAKKSKYPPYDNSCIQLLANDFRNQLIANDSICPRNPIQSNPIRNPIQSLNSDNKKNGEKDKEVLVNTSVLTLEKEFIRVKTDDEGNPLPEPKSRKNTKEDYGKYGNEIKRVFESLDKARGYSTTKRNIESAAICRMLKHKYTVEQINDTWMKLKSDKFWNGKELFMTTVESHIGAIIKAKPVVSVYEGLMQK